MKKALFLDRDGVINIDHGYVGKIEDFEFVDGILDFIKSAQKKGYLPIIVTNQSGIGRGYYSLEDFEKLTDWMLKKMRQAGIEIDRSHVFHCPHSPDAGCNCRKPMPGMLLEAKQHFNIDMKNSWMIGDKQSDIEAAKNAGVGHTYLTEKNRKLDEKELYGF
ncbi:D-glycero-beta-D-manno-heptose 1,7-bisphosphate 7-phosphatase [Hydrogenimonas thermophila]|uniref:D-glycero-beta-D-manno-heptose 1,7-bisphosphate 7-phosphatase n=1 Tax=Hydrogenimonas thermophila TaxID=223786 RepID=UPI00293707D8|nr:D-glycero-beta-D-manno-heptose 1,7-bisphosphate 7-phosphatase [Hydrogenimonas thermophila]WOE69550.1 D-glycero-beta-D-manno-heptose 1,7-bisphosphate 7-phosphatase [Hydrogenimonas thermophila]WOE72064.1 D-glycero-beta-D-manno-heptose 1,7-bisphosphate 7-phosphatase [Hydrogenimonas thermophila]